MGFMINIRTKKISLVSGNRPGESFFYHSPARRAKCVSEYTLLILKNIKQTNKKTRIKKAKETKEEKRISPENG